MISAFCTESSPTQAEEALVSFTRYLRGNMESLNQSDLIPFEHELRHIQNYVNIEKMRFGDRLEVAYNIGCSQFLRAGAVDPAVGGECDSPRRGEKARKAGP